MTLPNILACCNMYNCKRGVWVVRELTLAAHNTYVLDYPDLRLALESKSIESMAHAWTRHMCCTHKQVYCKCAHAHCTHTSGHSSEGDAHVTCILM